MKILENNRELFIMKVFLKDRRNRQIIRVINLLIYKAGNLIRTEFRSLSFDGLKDKDWKLIKAHNFEDI